ncbi:MAG: hypothetical protein WC992_05650 [Acholeplasmataceae bacterium]|jgi:hypothetical protein|nr:hypothetical protein [Acholeplasmataceae bacterium]
MKHIVERYIYAVTKRLPENMKEDVKEELGAHIADMIGEQTDEAEIDRILHQLGHPRELAKNYRGHDSYVISPFFYDDYIQVLKIVGVIFLVVALTFGSIDAVLHVEATSVFGSIVEIFASILSNAISSLLIAFACVTLIFWGIDRAARDKKLPEWKLDDLPDLPKPHTTKISRVESILGLIFGTIFSTIFIVFMISYMDIVGFYQNGVMLFPIFNQSVINPFIPFFIISAVFGFIVSLLKLYYGEWKINLAIIYTVHQILSTVIMLIFVSRPQLITQDTFAQAASYFDMTTETLSKNFSQFIQGFIVFVCIIVGIDLLSTWIKTLKKKKA